jgi:hypothetical protein
MRIQVDSHPKGSSEHIIPTGLDSFPSFLPKYKRPANTTVKYTKRFTRKANARGQISIVAFSGP